MHLFDDSLLTSLAAFISTWRFVRLCKKCITIKRRRDFLSHKHRTLFYVCTCRLSSCNAGFFPYTRDQIVSQQSHLSAIRVNLTVRFNFCDVNSLVPFLEFWKSAQFTEQIFYHLSMGYQHHWVRLLFESRCLAHVNTLLNSRYCVSHQPICCMQPCRLAQSN